MFQVKKDDPPLELPTLPKLPSSFTEAWDTVTKSASSLVSGGETENQVTEEVDDVCEHYFTVEETIIDDEPDEECIP